MAIIHEEEIRQESILEIARKIIIAARTAPKTRGRDVIFSAIVTDEHIRALSERMKQIGEESGMQFFIRDAECILKAGAVVLIGAAIRPVGLDRCGYCGLDNCNQKNENLGIPCAFNSIDLGIALGSAVSLAADLRTDNRIMFTIGKAAKELGYLSEEAEIIMGIPLSSSSKNPFFDRS